MVSRTDQYLVDIDARRLGDGTDNRSCNVLAFQRRYVPVKLPGLLLGLGVCDVMRQLRCDRARLSDRDPNSVYVDFLMQRLRGCPHAPLAGIVDTCACTA